MVAGWLRPLGSRAAGYGSAGNTPTAAAAARRRSLARSLRTLLAAAALGVAALLLLNGPILGPDPTLVAWSLKGCPVKILELTTTIKAQYKAAVQAGLDPELGNPTYRKPKTAILNFVRYHTEVVAVTVYHFVKLRHNVTVFTRDDPLNMGDVLNPYFWKGFRKFERFFEHFHEYDNIVVATFPTCHDPTLRALLSLRLPQRYIALVHNPEYLNNTQLSSMVRDHDIRLLAISPHVGKAARQVLEDQGIQGKIDPARRNYRTIFAEMLAHKDHLLAQNFSLTILGKGGGRRDSSIVEVPQELVDAGLLKQYASLPFQEYYEVLHSCIALAPAFASDAYYVNKGSSSIGASLISGTPLIAHRYMLKAYNFLEEAAVFLSDEPMSDVEAMLWVLSQPPEAREAKRVGLAALRAEMYDRNLQVLQRMLGEEYMYKHKVNYGKHKGEYRPMYIDMDTPTKYFGQLGGQSPPTEEGADGEGRGSSSSEGGADDAFEDARQVLLLPGGGSGGEGGQRLRRDPR
ncbi:hypothetical protein C2E20_7512 [Micractinium conductrix]|uniref:Uncharacterized protein n=1 Tax=Micractinium conductrix TaxID=554055 RepID=A0A2P6V4G5_9CHLO|nr:hypothetical protein C2E20_7512 [Micractinium conductrix]|eukprot:PSC68981.1 hypothetical protein C2E20_7512 [Micractinium conductrix]